MWFMYLLTWAALIIQLSIATLSIAAGLYYLAELVEEYSVMTKKIVSFMIYATVGIHVGLIVFEDFSLLMNFGGMAACVAHFFLVQDFPYFYVTSPAFISAVVLLFFNHYIAFAHFSTVWYPFAEVLAYFTLCLWLVPFAFFVSLSANEYVLPTTSGGMMDQDDSDVVSNYFRKNKKKMGLLSFLKTAQDSVLPQRMRKQF